MRPRSNTSRWLCLVLLAALALASGFGRRPGAQARWHPQRDAGRRPAGVLDPRVVHDSSECGPLSPCYSKSCPVRIRSSRTSPSRRSSPSFAERWYVAGHLQDSSSSSGRTFRWHDGQPFSARTSSTRSGPHVKNLVPAQRAHTTTGGCRMSGWTSRLAAR